MTLDASTEDLFGPVVEFPDVLAQERLARLRGLDDEINRLATLLTVLVNPGSVEAWASEYHPQANGLLDYVLRRPPLVVLAGDVGTGKTELAETVGDRVSREMGITVTLWPLSLSTRGQGRVGEMTHLLSSAFDHAASRGARLLGPDGTPQGGAILLVDEADALAQSREAQQMHHEDRAGVNALIRGIDRIAQRRLPVAVVMCTNRLGALDPAIRRRAADVIEFSRPNAEQRRALLTDALSPLGLSADEIERLTQATDAVNGRDYGYTSSDLVQRLLPKIVLDAFPDAPVTAARALAIATEMRPTPPFTDSSD